MILEFKLKLFMIAFPSMLIKPADAADMMVPVDPDNYNKDEYPHFYLYCQCQLGQPMPSWTSHWDNAKIIASIPIDKIKTIKWNELLQLGFKVGHPIP